MSVKTFLGKAIFRAPDIVASGLVTSEKSIPNLIKAGILEKPIKAGNHQQSRRHWTPQMVERAFARKNGTAAE